VNASVLSLLLILEINPLDALQEISEIIIGVAINNRMILFIIVSLLNYRFS
jgi:hypothetical protein